MFLRTVYRYLIKLYVIRYNRQGYMKKYRIDKINKTIIFKFPRSEEITKQIKNCGHTARFDKYGNNWVVSVDDYTKPLIKAIVKDYGFKYEETKQVKETKFDYSLKDDNISKIDALCKEQNFTLIPRIYQKEYLGFCLEKTNVLCGEDVGVGKSFESIMYTETTNSFPCLVIVPASIKYDWRDKWLKIVTKDRSIAVIESKNKNNDWKADVVIINYDIIGKKAGTGATVRFDELKETEWKMVIFDEAHFLKNSKSQRAKAASKIVKKKPIIQLLSGTITMSKPIELWNLLKIAKVDHLIASSWMQYVEKYCGGYKGKRGWVTDGATNTIELNTRLRETCYIRREKRDVLKELPESIQQVIKVDITNKKELNKATDEFIDYMYNKYGEGAAERAMGAEHLVSLGVFRKLAIEGKMKAIERYLKDWKESGKKLVVFGLHREPLDYLSEKFGSMLIAGGVTAKKKQQIVKEWTENNDTFLFANMLSAGTGIDGLQKVCSNALVLELPWRPSDLQQLIGRIDRMGQKFVSSIVYLLSFSTIDLQMWEMLEEKEKVTEAVNKGVDIERQNSGMKSVMNKILKKRL